MLESVENQTAHCIVFRVGVVVGVVYVEEHLEVVHRALPVYEPAVVVVACDDVGFFLVVVVHGAHEGLHYVLQGDYARAGTVFVTYERAAYLLLLHLLQHGIDAHVLVEVHGLVYHLPEVESRLAYAEHIVLERKHAHHMVEVAVGDRIRLEEVLLDSFAYLLLSHLPVQPDYVAPEGHDRVHLQVAEGEDTLHDVLLYGRHLSLVGTLLDYRLYLLLCHLGLLLLDAEYLDYQCGALRKQPHEGGCYHRDHLHRPRDHLRHLLRGAEGNPLGHQLSEHDAEIGHEYDYDSLRETGCETDRHPGLCKGVGKRLGNLVAGEYTGEDSDEGDAYLHRRQELVRVGGKVQGGPGGLAALACIGLQVGLARRHDRHFGHGEYSVEQDKEKDYENFAHIISVQIDFRMIT